MTANRHNCGMPEWAICATCGLRYIRTAALHANVRALTAKEPDYEGFGDTAFSIGVSCGHPLMRRVTPHSSSN